MRVLGARERGTEWWEIPRRGARMERGGWRAGAVRTALCLEAALVVFCLFVATMAHDEAVELFFPLVVLGTPLVVLATVALLVFRYFTAGARDVFPTAAQLTGEERLRRRYVAGELSESEFKVASMMLAKDGFTRGQLSVAEYERALDQLLERERTAAVHDAAHKTTGIRWRRRAVEGDDPSRRARGT